MADLPRELHELAGHLSRWLACQRRLGASAAPRRVRRLQRPAAQVAASAEAQSAAPGLTLDEVRADLGDCQRCKLAPRRTHLVFGRGDPAARLLLVGEAPGAEEDLQGLPFVGAAGQLLDRLLEKLGLARDEVYIANVLKCRPPGNRTPEPDEIAACSPFLFQQIRALQPQFIVALGAVATQVLLDTKAPLGRLRGRWQPGPEGLRVMPTFHPSYLLRFPAERKKTWEDMQQVMAEYRR